MVRVFLFASLSEDGGGDADVRGCVDAAGVVFPKVTQLVMDDILAGRGERLWGLIGVAAAAYLGRDGFNALRIILNNTFEQRVIFDLEICILCSAVAAAVV